MAMKQETLRQMGTISQNQVFRPNSSVERSLPATSCFFFCVKAWLIHGSKIPQLRSSIRGSAP